MMDRIEYGFASALLLAASLAGFTWGGTGAAVIEEMDTSAVQLVVDLDERQLHVVSGGEVTKSYSVAIGKDGHPTPTGSFNVRRIIWNPSWTPPDVPWARGRKPTPPGAADNPMGRVKIFFAEPDYFIHGTNDTGSVGSAASHGCLRMRNPDVIELAKLLMENGGASRPESWFRRIINRVTDTQEVRLTTAIPLRIRN